MKSKVVTVTLNPALDKTVTVENLQFGHLNRVNEMRIDPGGKGINVAKVLRNFGIDVTATGLIAGSQGELILKQLNKLNISSDFLEVQGETRINLKISDQKTKLTTEINELGFTVSQADLENFKFKLANLLKDVLVLVLGGSLPQGVPEDIYKNFIEMANSMGVKTILDADGNVLREGIKAIPYAVKPNIYELENLVGKKLETEHEVVAVGKSLIESGIKLVVISMGSKGSILLNEQQAVRATPFEITPESTVGAGDSMVAVAVYSLLQRYSLEQIARWATTAGTISASKFGTQACTFSEVEESVHKVHVLNI